MKLVDLFVSEAMDLSLQTTTKSETMRQLAERFALVGGIQDVDAYVEKLEAREAQSTTGVGDEIPACARCIGSASSHYFWSQ